MSIHYSRFGLNTYGSTPYFRSQIPDEFDLDSTMIAARAYRNLPPNVKKLASMAKQWTEKTYQERSPYMPDIGQWYDEEGYELDPDRGERLTDDEIEQSWEGQISPGFDFEVEDIPIPKGGFPDPLTWEPPLEEEEPDLVDRAGLTETDVRAHVERYGLEDAARAFGVPKSWMPRIANAEALAREVLGMHGKPWPPREDSASSP